MLAKTRSCVNNYEKLILLTFQDFLEIQLILVQNKISRNVVGHQNF